MVTLPEGVARRLDKALAAAVPESAHLSRTRLQALIAAGAVSRAGEVVTDPGTPASPGEVWVVQVPPPRGVHMAAEAIPLNLVFEDDDVAVIDKPAGMVVHPAPGSPEGTLVNALLHHFAGGLSGVGGALRPGIVHRIDKDTSGLLVVAKSDRAHHALAALFAAHAVERSYLALVRGAPDMADPRLAGLDGVTGEAGGVIRIQAPIGRHPGDRKRMAVVKGGRHAVTRVRVLERYGPPERPALALVECRLETGRTHQIRVHLSHVGHPLVGDPVYGRPRPIAGGALAPEAIAAVAAFPRQALHAATLGFEHPADGRLLQFSSPVPDDLNTLLTILQGSRG